MMILDGSCGHGDGWTDLFSTCVLVPSVEVEPCAMIDGRLYLFEGDTSDGVVDVVVIGREAKALDDGTSKVGSIFRLANVADTPSSEEVVGMKRARAYSRDAGWCAHLYGGNISPCTQPRLPSVRNGLQF